MSGGSWDYFYNRVREVADRLQGRDQSPDRRALGAHLRKVAQALHDIEWVDSCDYVAGDETEAIRAVVSPADRLEAATEAAKLAHDELRAVLLEVLDAH